MSGAVLRDAGDSALLLEFEEVIAPDVNAAAIAAAAAIRGASVHGVRDVVSTFRSVAVYFDPLATDHEALRAAIARASAAASDARASESSQTDADVIEVPVAYGGGDGPDLAELAAQRGVTVDAAIARHVEPTYRVFMLGFLPGFAYMGSVDPGIATPRRASPRLRVPAGSVGIAGFQTGIYPFESPGGWQIIGRTALTVFDAASARPALFAPGTRVRFTRAAGTADPRREVAPVAGDEIAAAPDVTVLQPGFFTTVQDEGRWGHQGIGVPVSGAMDVSSHRLANALVGNDRHAATLEATIVGPELRLERETRLAIAGADLGASLAGADLPPGRAVRAREGDVLRFRGGGRGGRAYLALAGGVDVPPVLGSRATHVRTRMGGLGGRALRAGDRLRLGSPGQAGRPRAVRDARVSASVTRLRVLPGPQRAYFPESAIDALVSSPFVVAPESDRMGYRLAGARPLAAAGREMISDATFAGALQVPPSGQPILLMADRQTTGGYPQIAVVITADLAAAGQLVPGDRVEFALCTRAEALAALERADEGWQGA